MAAAPAGGSRQAMIVAVEQYDDLADLDNVDYDANLLATTLIKLNWKVEMVWGKGLQDTKLAIQRFAESVSGSGAACLLAFIGHGVEMGGNIFLVPKDAVLGGEEEGGGDRGQLLRFAEVQEMFARRGESEATVFLLDCCRSGLPSSFQGEGSRGGGVVTGEEGQQLPGRCDFFNSITIFSTSSGRKAADGQAGKGGPFMNAFTEELLKPGHDIRRVTMNTRIRLKGSSVFEQMVLEEGVLMADLFMNLEVVKCASKTTWRVISQKDSRAFQVREEALGALQRWVEDEGGEQPGRMLVHGLGGTGKTTLGKIFAARAAAEGVCEAVLFLTLSDGSCMEEYVEVAKKLGASAESVEGMSEEKLRARVHGLLSSEKWEGKWLVVLDDLPDTEDKGVSWVGKEFPFGSGKTLVTSRCAEWAEGGGAEMWGKVTLLGMTEAEACEWVRRRWVAWAGDEAGVLKLVRKLECLPLAIDQAAAFSREWKIATPELYLEAQAKRTKTLEAQWEIILKRGYPFFFFEVVSHTFMTLAEAGDKNSVGAINLLKKMAFLHSEGIQQDLFQDEEWIHVSTLKRHSLVVDSSLGGVAMHALSQEVLRVDLMGNAKEVALGGVLQSLECEMSKFIENSPATYVHGRRYVRHVKAATSHAHDGPARQDDVLGKVCWAAGIFLSAISCSFEEALEMHKMCLGAFCRAHGADHTVVAGAYNNMANVYQKQGKYVEALERHEQSTAIKIKTLGKDHGLVAASYIGMAIVYSLQAKYPEALALYEKSRAIMSKVLPHDLAAFATLYNGMAEVFLAQGRHAEALTLHTKVIEIKGMRNDNQGLASSYSNMATVYQKLGMHADALALYEKGQAIKIAVLGEDHLDVAWSYNNIANVYAAQSRYTEALALHEKSQAITIKVLGKDNLDIVASYNGMATIYHAQCKYVAALELFEKGKAIMIKALGHNHTDVALAYNNIANVFERQGKHAESMELHEKSLAIRINVLGHNHADVAGSYSGMAIIYEAQRRYAESLALHEKSHAIMVKVLPHDHPNVAASYHNMANVYQKQEMYSEALALYEKSRAVLVKVLGHDNLHVAASYNNIAVIYVKQEKYVEALASYEKCKAIRIKVLTHDHMSVATSYYNMAGIYETQGEYAKAREMLEASRAIMINLLGRDHADVSSLDQMMENMSAAAAETVHEAGASDAVEFHDTDGDYIGFVLSSGTVQAWVNGVLQISHLTSCSIDPSSGKVTDALGTSTVPVETRAFTLAALTALLTLGNVSISNETEDLEKLRAATIHEVAPAEVLESIPDDFEALSSKELKAMLKEWGVDTSDCFEKSDLLAKVRSLL